MKPQFENIPARELRKGDRVPFPGARIATVLGTTVYSDKTLVFFGGLPLVIGSNDEIPIEIVS